MRIIVDTGLNAGAAEYKNMGDIAMLQVAVVRLLRLWPSARVEVLTESPENLARYCPGAFPLSRAGRDTWVDDRILLGRMHRILPAGISLRLRRWHRALGARWPALLERLIAWRFALKDGEARAATMREFLGSLNHADLLVVCGSGGFADSCQAWNLSTLNTVEAAHRRRVPVAMFGQGMGPLTDTAVLARAKQILPDLDLITLRGSRGGLALLESLGVAPAKILTTGDEAIELAYAARVEKPGAALGVNLRVASYADVTTDFIEKIREVLQAFARRHGAPLLPIPIAFHEQANDHQSIRRLLAGMDDTSDGGLTLDSPLKLIEQTGRCRVVVTGAFHAAVFALAQGIPVVGLANSAYYSTKFQGLQDLFGLGCEIVMLNEPEVPAHLASALERAWDSAAIVRQPLLQAAGRQIAAGQNAYQRVRDLLASRKT